MMSPVATLSPKSETTENRDALKEFQDLQRRVMRLLLLYEQNLFHDQFRTFYLASSLLMELYELYIKLRTLSDELLNDIMPRIRRQLSLQISRTHLYENAPTHGDIDWQQTLQRSWNIYPGMIPLHFETHIYRQSVESPENIFVASVLLYYNEQLQHILGHSLGDDPLRAQEREELIGVDERTERELATPYVRILKDQAAYIDDAKYSIIRLLMEQEEVGYANDIACRVAIDQLIEQVEAHLRPGPSPYRDLIAWWYQFSDLTRTSQQHDTKKEVWLYNLWVALEFIHLLHEKEHTQPEDIKISKGYLAFTFRWKEDRPFRFIYDEQLSELKNKVYGWQSAPCLHSPFRIERIPALEVNYQRKLIWREPPVLLNTLCTFEEPDRKYIDDSIKRLFGDMRLLDAEQGVIFSPWPPAPSSKMREVKYEPKDKGDEKPDHRYYHPNAGRDINIQFYQFHPTSPSDVLIHLRAILDRIEKSLWKRPAIACRGIWLDFRSQNDGKYSVTEKHILCPKPHIGNDVFDLVISDQDCFRNSHVCHIIEQPGAAPPRIDSASTLEELFTLNQKNRETFENSLAAAKERKKG